MDLNLQILLEMVSKTKASDLHITVGLPPMLRVNGKLIRTGQSPLMPEDTEKIVESILTTKQMSELEQKGEIDCSISASSKFRFRVNCFKQRNSYAAALRSVDSSILSIKDLKLPDNIVDFTTKSKGLVLVTGPTGSGKSTTLAALIDIINTNYERHIITLEDPVEFLHSHKKSIVNQREIGTDSKDFKTALRASLREDPDVILVGEMRDHESISIALTAAETGHLVFSTLHTIGAAKTIDRIIDVFPPSQQQQIKVQLSMTLEGVISQQLLQHASGNSRIVATEMMFCTPAIRNMIREGKTHQINNAILSGGSSGMVSMDNSLIKLYKQREISYDDLMLYCMDCQYIKQSI